MRRHPKQTPRGRCPLPDSYIYRYALRLAQRTTLFRVSEGQIPDETTSVQLLRSNRRAKAWAGLGGGMVQRLSEPEDSGAAKLSPKGAAATGARASHPAEGGTVLPGDMAPYAWDPVALDTGPMRPAGYPWGAYAGATVRPTPNATAPLAAAVAAPTASPPEPLYPW